MVPGMNYPLAEQGKTGIETAVELQQNGLAR
jgi:hypothetical protein